MEISFLIKEAEEAISNISEVIKLAQKKLDLTTNYELQEILLKKLSEYKKDKSYFCGHLDYLKRQQKAGKVNTSELNAIYKTNKTIPHR